ncbi:MAG: flagellar export chaperone FlgN [Planctomycetota bacterium]|jgi:hypothetical protein
MSHELVTNLIGVLEEQAHAFGRLRDAMTKTRGAFTSLGARRLQAAIEDLHEHALKLAKLESGRGKIVDGLRQALGLEGAAQVSRIAPRLPASLARPLQQAAGTAAAAARRLRTECEVGTHLLRLSEDANAGIIESLLGLNHGCNAFYDCNARSKSADMPGGNLISGTA